MKLIQLCRFVAIFVGLLAFSFEVWAEEVTHRFDEGDNPFEITASSVEFERATGVYVARGNVRIIHPDRTLDADWVAFNNITRQGVAVGNVVVVDEGDTMRSNSLLFNVDKFVGVVFEGSLKGTDSEFDMSAKTVKVIGENSYKLSDGTFTTCRCPDEEKVPWDIRAEETDIEVDGYGTARNTTFNILGVPVLWFPWMIYPLKTDRQTGFLFPNLGDSDRGGNNFGLPFFWAARQNLNITYSPGWLGKRGLMNNVEVEYVFGESSWSELFLAFIRDEDISSDDPSTPFNENRWALEWLHYHELPDDWRLKSDVRLFSDNLYPFDYDSFGSYSNDRFVESRIFLERRFGESGWLGLNGGIWWADDQQNPDNSDRDRYLLQRLPSVELSASDRPLPIQEFGLVGSFEVNYNYFDSRTDAEDMYPQASLVRNQFLDTGVDSIPDGDEQAASSGQKVFTDANSDNFVNSGGPEGDGRFTDGEPLVNQGHRVTINPRVARPFRIGDLVEIYPEIGYIGTFYNTEETDEVRHLVTGRVDVRTRFRKMVTLPVIQKRLLHVLEPRLGYAGITSVSQRDNPLFIPKGAVLQERLRELEMFNVTRDPSDRIDSANEITFGAGNRFYGLGTYEEDGEIRQFTRLLADLSLVNRYSFSESTFTSSYIDGSLYPMENVSTRFNLGYDVDDKKISEGLFYFGWDDDIGHNLSLYYRYVRTIPPFFGAFKFDDDRFDEFEDEFTRVSQVSLYSRTAFNKNWAASASASYSFENSLWLGSEYGIEYISRCLCWAIRLEAQDSRTEGFEINLRYRLIGLGDDTVRPFEGKGGRSRRESTDL